MHAASFGAQGSAGLTTLQSRAYCEGMMVALREQVAAGGAEGTETWVVLLVWTTKRLGAGSRFKLLPGQAEPRFVYGLALLGWPFPSELLYLPGWVSTTLSLILLPWLSPTPYPAEMPHMFLVLGAS